MALYKIYDKNKENYLLAANKHFIIKNGNKAE